MSPAEDAQLLIVIVQRHMRSLRVSLDPSYPDEDWGFTAQQALEKLLKLGLCSVIVCHQEFTIWPTLLNWLRSA